jgi:hypothetical protein
MGSAKGVGAREAREAEVREDDVPSLVCECGQELLATIDVRNLSANARAQKGRLYNLGVDVAIFEKENSQGPVLVAPSGTDDNTVSPSATDNEQGLGAT